MITAVNLATDSELLAAYVRQQDDAAFAELISRHGPMVYRTCLRLLRDAHESEDASQAVFIALATKACGLKSGDLAPWLHRVAHLVAAETVRKRMRRSKREEEFFLNEPAAAGEDTTSAILAAAEHLLDQLPFRYRQAVVLRYLEGKSQEESAQLAGCPVGTLKQRASRGIEKLRQHLVKRGFDMPGLALVGLLEAEAKLKLPETLLPTILAAVKTAAATGAAATAGTSSAIALAKGALKAMFWTKVKMMALAGGVAVVVAGVPVAAHFAFADDRSQKTNTPSAAAGFEEIVTTNAIFAGCFLLPQSGGKETTDHLLLLGREQATNSGILCSLLCWNMRDNKLEWQSVQPLFPLTEGAVDARGAGSLLKEALVAGNIVVAGGPQCMLAVDHRSGVDIGSDGKKYTKWGLFVSPTNSTKCICGAAMCNDSLVLCLPRSSTAIDPKSGQALWTADEKGEFYSGPYSFKDRVIVIRDAPAEIVVRDAATGHSVTNLSLPGLTRSRKHPAAILGNTMSGLKEKYPVAFAGNYLVTTDGKNYNVADLETLESKRSLPVTKLDPAIEPAMRFWMNERYLFVLKPYYSVLENVIFDLRSGEMLWRQREGGKRVDAGSQRSDARKEPPAVGSVLDSVVFADGRIYGVPVESSPGSRGGGRQKGIDVVCLDQATGKKVATISDIGLTASQYAALCCQRDGYVLATLRDGRGMEFREIETATSQTVRRLRADTGRDGISSVAQGPYLAILAPPELRFQGPGVKKAVSAGSASQAAIRYGRLLAQMALLCGKQNADTQDVGRVTEIAQELNKLGALPEMTRPSPDTWPSAVQIFLGELGINPPKEQLIPAALLFQKLNNADTKMSINCGVGSGLTLEMSDNLLSVCNDAMAFLPEPDRKKLAALVHFKRLGSTPQSKDDGSGKSLPGIVEKDGRIE